MKKKKVVIIGFCITIAIALVSVIINTVAFYLPAKRKQEENERLLKEYYQTKVEAFEQENSALSNVDIVFLGDSLTDGYDVATYYNEYTAVNRGIGGDTTFGLENRLKVSAYDINPKVVCVLIGGNNLSTMMQNYEQIITKLKTNLPSSKIVLLSLTALGGNFASKNKVVIENNQYIKSLAQKHSVEFVDLFTALYDYDSGEIKSAYTTDGAHLSNQGYEVITSKIKPVVSALIE